MRVKKVISIVLDDALKQRLLSWAQQFQEVIWLDSNAYPQKHTNFEAILAVDAFTAIKTDYLHAFDKLEAYQQTTKDWIFGYLTYDLKNDVEKLTSANFDKLHFPDLYFFQPKKLFIFKENTLEIQYLNLVSDEIDTDWETITQINYKTEKSNLKNNVSIKSRISKETYLKKVARLQEYIQQGETYETNFCQEFFIENHPINPLQTYLHLTRISQTPFASFLKLDTHFALCASPERYLLKKDTLVLSQPIKGTAKRSENTEEDQRIKNTLLNDEKERSENIMIVDLVRNDLSRFATKNSVTVTELCEAYSFKQVHQLVSTVTCQVSSEESPVRFLKQTFPMGSMTGAPKIAAMKIIEELEVTKRGLYSGAIGYFTPQGDFDFNVVIRSILYNSQTNYVSFSVGGAITVQANAEKEYQECILKAKGLFKALSDR
jgi:para-aminobenzoate synthetase component 1